MDSKFPYAQKMIVALGQGIATDLKLHNIISCEVNIMGRRSNKALQTVTRRYTALELNRLI